MGGVRLFVCRTVFLDARALPRGRARMERWGQRIPWSSGICAIMSPLQLPLSGSLNLSETYAAS